MKTFYRSFLLPAVTAVLLSVASCMKDPVPDEGGPDRVPVSFCLRTAILEDGMPQTKTIQEPDSEGVTGDSQIANFLVLQFNGVTAEAPLVGGQVYFDHWPLTEDEQLTLVASEGPNTVVVLANTFGRISVNSGTTLGAFLEQDYTTIPELSGVFISSGGQDYLRMSASLRTGSITAGTSLVLTLRRNVAKIVVRVTNNTSGLSGDDVVTLSQVHLCGINAKYYYLAHIDPALTAGDASVAFRDPFSDAFPFRFDDVRQDFAGEGNAGAVQTYTYYVPANLRGTTGNTLQYNKGSGAPGGATRFRLYGTYGPGRTPIAYTYYLGGDLTSDFNLLPNHKYTYDISINAKGDARYDYRIEDMGEVTFGTDANCYMLHPPQTEGQSRTYAFPVRRAAVFWNESGVNGGVYGASTREGYSSYVLDGGTRWTAEVLWSDFDLSGYTGDDAFLVPGFDAGTGFDPANPAHSQPFIKVRVSAGMQGNVVVAMKVDGIILWSWHLWITDYDPDRYVVPVPGQYIYGVGGGEVHRYNNALWNTPATDGTVGYAKGFIMDRSLGAAGADPALPGSQGLFYQFGRKDPFLDRDREGRSNYFYLGGTASAVVTGSLSGNGIRVIGKNQTGAAGARNTLYAVTHPMTFICQSSQNWTAADDDMAAVGRADSPWHDRLFWQHAGNQASLEHKKSVYDPCPAGWKVPVNGVWNGFSPLTTENEPEGTYTTVWDQEKSGRYYYPEGFVRAEQTGRIFLYASGTRSDGSGACRRPGEDGVYWASSAHSATVSYTLTFDKLHAYSNNGYYDAYGCPVRCVRE